MREGRIKIGAVVTRLFPVAGGRREEPVFSSGSGGETAVKWILGVNRCQPGEPWRAEMNHNIGSEAACHIERAGTT